MSVCHLWLKLFHVISHDTPWQTHGWLKPPLHTHTHTQSPTYTSPPLHPVKKKKRNERKTSILTWIYCSAHPIWQHRTEQRDTCIPKNGAAGWKASLWHCRSQCLWQDGITQANLSMNGRIWICIFTVTCKLHSLYMLCMFETTWMDSLQKGCTEPVYTNNTKPWLQWLSLSARKQSLKVK